VAQEAAREINFQGPSEWLMTLSSLRPQALCLGSSKALLD
jgi:hypothetical protein